MHSFPLPPGFEPPPDTELEGTFEAVATLKLHEDGTLSLVAIDGAELPQSEKPKSEPEPNDEPMPDEGMMARMSKAMGKPQY